LRLRKTRFPLSVFFLPFLTLAPTGCNTLAGIEPGRLGLCSDGSRIDETNCTDGGTQGAGGSSSSESSSGNGSIGTCDPPWQRRDPFSSRCYLQEYAPREWAIAELRCVDLGGHLVAIDSASELGSLTDWVGAEVWIGATDVFKEGVFVWTNGQPWTFSSWKDGSQVDPEGKRDCVMLTTKAGSLPVFESRLCSEKRAYVCESPPNNP
jgi:Lectin C-type domain